MKHISRSILFIASVCFVASLSFGQTLADAAREQQAKKKTPTATGHVYTNESLGFHPAPADAAPAKSSDTASTASKDDKTADKTEAAADVDPADAAAAKKKSDDDLKDKVAKQIAEIATLQRELDILLRENRLRAAAFYGDAGARLRDEAKYAAEDRKYQADIAAKQKAIADGQANLDKLREQARRTGVPVS